MGNVLLVALFISAGLGVEKLFTRYLNTRYFRFQTNDQGGLSIDAGNGRLCSMDKFSATLVRLLPDFIGLFVFTAVALIAYFLFARSSTPFLQLFFLATLLCITMIRGLMLLSQTVFSPTILQFRVLPVQCTTATTLHRLLIWTGGYMIVSIMFSIVSYKLGADYRTLQLLLATFATLILVVTAVAVLLFRKNIRRQILLAVEGEPGWGRQKFADIWHMVALLYVVLLWLLILLTMDSSPETRSRGAFLLSFFIVPIWLVMDRLVQWIVLFSVKTLKIHDDTPSGEMNEEERLDHDKGRRFYQTCRATARWLLVIALAVWLASLWGISFPFLSRFTKVFFDAAIIMFIALLFWQFVSSWIERKIEESLPEEEQDATEDDEWGGAASKTRSYTLLPMVRKFIGSILVVMVTMTVLSSMGVDIGPLLAGAGVIGLAVGFGAQKLVADMFSGFFYLLDDAFRVGEYLEAGSASGTVEGITLRNVMLRHHRGMLQIVPHSDLGSITNFMRGGIIVKFNLDFPYDADIDKIRKIIKKVGQAMLQDEEFGKDFIRPVKSQGVREITNSVMTIRVKFTARPGAHFVIRREAFKRITEALHAKNIHYAHRKVIVDIPQQLSVTSAEDHIQAAGAAAQQAVDDSDRENRRGGTQSRQDEM